MSAIELVSNRETKVATDKKRLGILHQVTYEHGAMVRISGSNIILSPPLVVTQAHVATILSALDAGLAAIS